MNDRDQSFWFPVKKYGWGWGPPVRWQGWAVLAAYLVLLLAGILYFDAEEPAVLAYTGVLTAFLVLIVVAKGERPARWRWGKRNRDAG